MDVDPDGGARLLAAIRLGAILLDGGMGTSLMAGTPPGSLGPEPSRANLIFPDLVLSIHRAGIAAGSSAVLTNTFGANRDHLDRLGFGREFAAINRLAVSLAREAAGPSRFVLGSIGPITGPSSSRSYREQARLLVDAGADALILETHTFDQALSALECLAPFAPFPIFASLWTWPADAPSSARRLEDAGASAIGTNCGRGLDDVLAATSLISGSVSVPLLAKPSAGPPDTRGILRFAPEDFGLAAPKIVALGVRLLGGCCGTDERYISAMRGALGPGQR